jgi:hypothetical protein
MIEITTKPRRIETYFRETKISKETIEKFLEVSNFIAQCIPTRDNLFTAGGFPMRCPNDPILVDDDSVFAPRKGVLLELELFSENN